MRLLGILDWTAATHSPASSACAYVINDLRIPRIGGTGNWGAVRDEAELCDQSTVSSDIADVYDHKHQVLSVDDREKELSMSMDIGKAFFMKRQLMEKYLHNNTFRTIKATYYRMALDFVNTFQHDAEMNGLTYDRHTEKASIEMFAGNIMAAGEQFLERPMERLSFRVGIES